MSSIVLCEPTQLYNILNQNDLKGNPCIADRTYLLLLDVRDHVAYEESHILTSRHSVLGPDGDFTLPADAEVETKHYCVVYDSATNDTSNKESDVYKCAKMLSELTCKTSILILKGGYEKFSALYPFLKSIQVIFSPRELQELELFPIEVVPGTVFMGNIGQANNQSLLNKLNVKCLVNTAPECQIACEDERVTIKNVEVSDGDLLPQLREIAQLIENFRAKKAPILIVSSDSISRAVIFVVAYFIKRNKWTLEKSWNTLCQHKNYIRPTLAYMKQLSNFEEEICETRSTNIAIPNLM